MDIFLQQMIRIIAESFNKNVQFVIELFTQFNRFMSKIRNGNISFSAAVPFSMAVAVTMSFFEVIVYLLNKNELGALIFCYMAFFTWFMIVICGMALWLTSILFGGSTSLLKTITAFQFLSIGFVFIRMLELPSLMVTHKVILSQSEPFQKDISGLISQNVLQNSFSFTSSILVLVGYLILGYWVYRMLRVVHQLRWWKAVGATGFGAWLISAAVTYIQHPIVQILLFANQA